MASRDVSATFKANVKLVLVRAVVRDAKGNAIGNLQKENFLVFDKGKPQVVTFFSVEKAGPQAPKEQPPSTIESAAGENTAPVVPERYVAYLFDDIHIQVEELERTRDAALRHFATLLPTDRAALFTTSGLTAVDFTDDHNKLKAALIKLTPHVIARRGNTDCPNITYYEADLIMKNEPGAVANAMQEARECAKGDPRGIMLTTAQGVLAAGQHEASIARNTLKHLVDGMARLPGQRSVILVSPGFYAPGFESELGNIIDRAVRSQIAINALDARGLYVILPFGDASEHSQNIPDLPTGSKATYQYAAAKADADVMNDLTDGTGGTFFWQNNDFDEGFRRVAETPAYTYTLGFAPQDLKPDGKFHSLSVKLKDSGRFSIQARRGYFAPKKLEDAAEQSKEDLQEAIFSQEQMHDLPLDLHMQFFKSSDDQAKLTILAHLDARHIHFTKNAGRNDQELTIVSAVFNSNGSFLSGNQKIVTLHLKDETLQAELTNGITTKANFEVKPGSYLVRVVVRDSQGQLSAQNGAIDIP